MPQPAPAWDPQPPGPRQAYEVWVPLVAETDLVAAQWAGKPGSPAPSQPPPEWPTASGLPAGTFDEGYSQAATGFRVTRLRLFQDGPPGTDFTYDIWAPDGTPIAIPGGGSLVATGPGWSAWVPVPATMTDGRGLWRISINRIGGSSVAAPALLGTGAQGNAVREPYVSPYGDLFEGILGVEFDGDEILPGSPTTCAGTVLLGECDSAGVRGPTTLEVTFSPTLPVGTTWSATWMTTLGPASTQTGTVSGAPLGSLVLQVAYPSGTFYPSAVVNVVLPTGQTDSCVVQFGTGAGPGVAIPDCPDAPCRDIELAFAPPSPCVKPRSTTQVVFTAIITPATPAFSGPIKWQVRNPAGTIVPWSGPAPSGTQLTYDVPSKGMWEVTASIDVPSSCGQSPVSDSVLVPVVDCDCPSFIGDLAFQNVDGCTFTFSASVSNPKGAALTFAWDFGAGPDTSVPNSPAVTKRFPTGTAGTRKVTVTVTAGDCSDSISKDVAVDCPGPGDPGDPGDPGGPGGGGGGGNGGISLCCILIGIWGAFHLAAGSALYFGAWWVALGLGIVASIALVAWTVVCCWPCARRPWSCCTWLQWQFVFNALLVTELFGLYALSTPGNGAVRASFGAALLGIGIAMGTAGCRVPNPYWPPDWPPCRC